MQLKGRFERPADIERLIVDRRGGKPVTLAEVARVEDGEKAKESSALVDGRPAVTLEVIKARGENTIAVVDEVKRALEELRPQLPPGASIEVVRDASTGIRNSVRDVQKTLVEGGTLTVLIVFLFLASWRSTVITGLTLPISLIGAFAFIYLLRLQPQHADADGAVAVRGTAHRRRDRRAREHRAAHRDGQGSPHGRAGGDQRDCLAVLATTLSIVAVFLPVGFMGGIIGRFFHQFGLTVVAAIVISMFVSFTLDPMLSSVWRDPQAEGQFGRGRWAACWRGSRG